MKLERLNIGDFPNGAMSKEMQSVVLGGIIWPDATKWYNDQFQAGRDDYKFSCSGTGGNQYDRTTVYSDGRTRVETSDKIWGGTTDGDYN